MCDGETTLQAIAERLRDELGVDDADALVWRALVLFKRKHLLADGFDLAAVRTTLSRRKAIAQIGLTAAMVPLVTSIVAPSALQAQSFNSQTFTWLSGITQTFVVPAGVTSINIDA